MVKCQGLYKEIMRKKHQKTGQLYPKSKKRGSCQPEVVVLPPNFDQSQLGKPDGADLRNHDKQKCQAHQSYLSQF